VGRQYCREFSVHIPPSRDIVYRIVKQLNEAGNVGDECAKGCKPRASVHTEVGGVNREAITKSQKKKCDV
jgi:hypothetical protein